MEAVEIDGFDVEDAVRALELTRALKGASDKEAGKIQNQMKAIYQANWKAIKAYNVREAADRKSQEDESKEKKRQEKKDARKNKGLKGKMRIDI